MRKPTRTDLTADEVRDYLYYDVADGYFSLRRATTAGRPYPAGHRLGSIHKHGYRIIRINRKDYIASRLAWLYVFGEWPKNFIDHINGNKSDDSLLNLREAGYSENKANTPKYKNNKSGYKGVYLNKKTGRYTAQIRKDKYLKQIGTFDTAEQAHEAYCQAAKDLHGEFANFGHKEAA